MGQINSNSLSSTKPYELVSCHGRNLEIKNMFQVILSEFHFKFYKPFGQIKPFFISKFIPWVRSFDPVLLI